MDEVAKHGTEINTALFELNLLHNANDIRTTLKLQSNNCSPPSVISTRKNYIVPPNTPVKLPMQLNPRYISKIYSSPRRMPNRVPPMRIRPYYIPERLRTKSENSDPTSSLYQETTSIVDALNYTMMDTCDAIQYQNSDISLNYDNLKNSKTIFKKILIKKSKSLEDVRVETTTNGPASSHEMEFMSSRIQKLKVQD